MKDLIKNSCIAALVSLAWCDSAVATTPIGKLPPVKPEGTLAPLSVEALTVTPAEQPSAGPANLNVAIAVAPQGGGTSCLGTLSVVRPDSGSQLLSMPVMLSAQGGKATLQPSFPAGGTYEVRLLVSATPSCKGVQKVATVKVHNGANIGGPVPNLLGTSKVTQPSISLKSVELIKPAKPGELLTFRVNLAALGASEAAQSCTYSAKINNADVAYALNSTVPKGATSFEFSVSSASLGLTAGAKHTVEVNPSSPGCSGNVKGEFNVALGQLNLARLISLEPSTPIFDLDFPMMRFNVRYAGKGKCKPRVFINDIAPPDMPDLDELPEANGQMSHLVDLSKYILARIPVEQRKGKHKVMLEDRTYGNACEGRPESSFTLVKGGNTLVGLQALGKKLTEPVELQINLKREHVACERITLDVNGKTADFKSPPIVNGLNGKSHIFKIMPYDPLYAFKESNLIKATGKENCAGSALEVQHVMEKKAFNEFGKLSKVSIVNKRGVTNYGDFGVGAGTPLELKFEGSGTCMVAIHLIGTNQWEHKRNVKVDMPKDGGSTIWKSDFNLPPYGKQKKVGADGSTSENKDVVNKDFHVSVTPNAIGCVGLPTVLKDKATCFQDECKP